MTVVSFNFSKIVVEKRKATKGRINIANNVALKDVTQAKVDFGAGKAALKFQFEFSTRYEPDFADIKMEGDLLFLTTEDESKEILAQWQKVNKVPKNINDFVFNHVLTKCYVEAVALSRDVGLPVPIQLPRVGQTTIAEKK
ncbi:MAG: hypothetical protein ABIH41_01265 [Nanoarchaeota archaeon]